MVMQQSTYDPTLCLMVLMPGGRLKEGTAGRGAVIDGCIALELLNIDVDERHGRLG